MTQPIKRIVTCQGSIQFLTAISVLNRKAEELGEGIAYKNYLIIYDLYAPNGFSEQFADFIGKMAKILLSWEQIIYVDSNKIKYYESILIGSGYESLCTSIHQLLMVDYVDQIYLARNWQFGNQLLINAYKTACKICYGDSIGVNISENYFTETPSKINILSLSYLFKTIKSLARDIIYKRNGNTANSLKISNLPIVDFDEGYFLLDDLFGYTPQITRLYKMNKRHLLEVFQACIKLLPENLFTNLVANIENREVTILMGSNFSEAGKMSQDMEIQAYCDLIIKKRVYGKNRHLIIKPHPRDDKNKLEKINELLKNQFSQITLLDSYDVFFLPFEIFFIKLMQEINGKGQGISVLTFSTACFSFPVFFNFIPSIGFGEDIIKKTFFQPHIYARIKHEKDLNIAVKRIEIN